MSNFIYKFSGPLKVILTLCFLNFFWVSPVFGGLLMSNFPDFIKCEAVFEGNPKDTYIFLQLENDDVSGWWWQYASSTVVYQGGDRIVVFNSDGSFVVAEQEFSGSDCDGFSISQLISNGQTFSIGSGSSGTSTVINQNSTTTSEVSTNPDLNIFLGFVLFFISFFIVVWSFKKR